MVIATRNESGPRGAAQRSGMKVVEAEAFFCKEVHGGRGNATTKGAVLPEAAVINEDQQYVGRTFGSFYRLWKLRRIGVKIRATNLTRKTEIRPRQYRGRTGVYCRLILMPRGLCRFVFCHF